MKISAEESVGCQFCGINHDLMSGSLN